jgi:LysM repeat protein
MKRLLLAAGALCASFCFTSPASARPADFLPSNPSTVAPASGSPPSVVLTSVQTPTLPQVTVVAGDTLWGIGIRTSRTWQALASFNHIPNPNLIYVGDVVVIPPASYAAGPVVLPAVPANTPPVHHYTAPTRTYTPSPAPVVSRGYGAPGSFQACVMFRESTNGAGSSNLYGILPSTWASLGLAGSPYSASRAQQDAAFQTLYARDGTSPWAPYDGC